MTTRLTRRERRANGERLTADVSRSNTSSILGEMSLKRGRHRPRHFKEEENKPKMGASARGVIQLAGVATAGAGVLLAAAVPNGNYLALEDKTGPLDIVMDSSTVAISVKKGAQNDVPLALTEDDPDGKMRSLTSGRRGKVDESDTAGVFSYPIPGAQRTSPFGSRVNPLTGESGEFHEGQDFAAPCGSDVKAAGSGVVTEAGWHPFGGGIRLVIDHGSGLATTYNHLSSIGVKIGDSISRGDVVAKAGTTGASTGCHLHFEVMIDNRKVNPMKWL